jgi:site-specific DNA recombinase
MRRAADRPPRRVVGYARVSSEEQARGSSLDDQQAAIRAYAKSRGLVVERIYVEAESARAENIEQRAEIRALMVDVRDGDLVVCDKLDRWSRDPEFTYGSIRKILAAGASFYAVGDQCDPSTHDGDTMLSVRVLVAREEHKRIKERMVGTRMRLRDRGYWSEGHAPFGYRRQSERKDAERNVLLLHNAEAALVRKVFALCIQGRAISRIVETTGLTRDVVAHVLRRREYTGEMRNSRDEWIRGKHPAIIDAATWLRARDALEERRLGGPRPRDAVSETSTWWLRDLARCALCGAKMSGAYAGPRGEGRRHYYRCSRPCTTRYVRVEPAEDAASELVLDRLADLREELAQEPKAPVRRRPVVDLAAERLRLARKRDRYLEAYSDGHSTRAELAEQMERLDAERLRLDAAEASVPRPADPAARRAALRHLGALRRAWTGASPSERREIAGRLARSVGLAAGRLPVFAWRPAVELVAQDDG